MTQIHSISPSLSRFQPIGTNCFQDLIYPVHFDNPFNLVQIAFSWIALRFIQATGDFPNTHAPVP